MVLGCDQITAAGERWESIDQFGWEINVVSSASELLKEFQKEEDPKSGLERIHVADRVLGIVNEAIRNEVIVARKLQDPPQSHPTSASINGPVMIVLEHIVASYGQQSHESDGPFHFLFVHDTPGTD